MKRFPKFLLVPVIIALAAALVCGYFAWEQPLMDVLPQEAWTHIQVRGDQWELVDEELPLFLEALRRTKVSRDSTPSNALSSSYLEFWIHCDLHEHPTLLYIQSNGDIAFAVHMDTEHYRRYEGGQELYNTLVALGLPVKN